MNLLMIKKWTRQGSRLVGQVCLFMAIWVVADGLARHWGSKIPGAVWGLGALLGLLCCRVVPAAMVETGAGWLLTEMLLFFVPVCVEIAGYLDVFAREGVRLAVAILLGTVTVMAGTAWVVDVVYRWETARNAARKQKEEPS